MEEETVETLRAELEGAYADNDELVYRMGQLETEIEGLRSQLQVDETTDKLYGGNDD